MEDDIIVSANLPVTTLAGDDIPALEDGEVPLCDADGNRIGTVHIRGDSAAAIVKRERTVVGSDCRVDRRASGGTGAKGICMNVEPDRACLRMNSGDISHMFSLKTWPRCGCGLATAPEGIEVVRPGGLQTIEAKSLLMRGAPTA